MAFMPLNLGVLVLFVLASRHPVLDPRVRRALRLLGIGSGMVFIGNAISAWYLTRAAREPAGLLGRSVLSLRFAASRSPRCSPSRWRGAPGSSGGSSCSTPRWCWWAAAWPSGTSRSGRRPRRRRARRRSSPRWRTPIRWSSMLVLLGITTVLLRRPVDGNRLAFGLLLTGVLVEHHRGPHVQPGAADGGRAERELDRRRLPGVLPDADRRAPSDTGAGRWRAGPGPEAAPAGPGDQPPALPRRRHHLRPALLVALRPWTEPVSGLAIGALLVTALVVIRQLLTVRENLRLLAETAARQNEARFRSLVQHSSDVILVTRADGTIRFVSPSAARVFGYDPRHDPAQRCPTCCTRRTATGPPTSSGTPPRRPGVTGPVEWRFRQPDGSWLHAEILATNLLHDTTVQGHRAQHPRRERAEAAGGAAHPPGVPRSAHRARQPRAVPRPGEPRARAGPPARAVRSRCCSSTSTTSRR